MSKHQVAQQRKDEDAALAASHGINIPRIFPTFEEARSFVMNSEGKLIARSEHPSELEGVSGINFSHVVELADVLHCEEKGGFWASFREYHEITFEFICRKKQERYYIAKAYCEQEGIDLEAYLAELTFSYWEFIPGHNLYVMLDPGVPDRYRVFANWKATDGEKWYETNSYDVFDGLERITDGRTPEVILGQIDRIFGMIKQAQSVFGEGAFSVIEMQLSHDGELYFLQRSQLPKSESVTWDFQDDSLQSWEFRVSIESGFGEVIGTTPKDGIEFELLANQGKESVFVSPVLNASGMRRNRLWNSVVQQAVYEQLPVHIDTDSIDTASGVRDPHSSIIPLTKPALYLNMPEWVAVMPQDLLAAIDAAWEKRLTPHMPDTTGQFKVMDKSVRPKDYETNPEYKPRLKLNIRSNGREARVRVLEVN